MSMYACPECGDDDHLYVIVEVEMRLIQDDDGNIQTDEEGSDNVWGDASSMRCSACGWGGTAQDALIDPEDTP